MNRQLFFILYLDLVEMKREINERKMCEMKMFELIETKYKRVKSWCFDLIDEHKKKLKLIMLYTQLPECP